jgi:hypothetical protein
VAVEKWLQANVRGWKSLCPDEKRALRDFPILWSYFEGWVTHPATANPERIATKIDGFLPNSFLDIVATDRAFEHYKKRYFPNGHEAELFEKLNLTGQWKDFVRYTLRHADPEPQQRAKAVLLIINRLRNNFLHGGKALYNFHGQLDNFQHANETLMELLLKWGPP